ncbi:MAG: LUD domain-containing protein [Ornithinimicrobium sp.]|uniref:LUD domain-containing protein n=1 Tax=Ornithinimicrobium sp. TaxID=1977084 RepID=UPI003D9AD87E
MSTDTGQDAAVGAPAQGLADTFADALRARGGTPHLVADLKAARDVVAELCAGLRVISDDDPVLTPVLEGLVTVTDPWVADIGLTTAVVAAAETSTLGLAFDAAHRRRTALVPPVHIALVPADRLVGGYAQTLGALGALRPVPSGIRLVSGPSSSGDIEQVHIRGMHGPVQVHVVVVATAGRDTAEEHAEPVQQGCTEPVTEPVAEAAPDAAPGVPGEPPAR